MIVFTIFAVQLQLFFVWQVFSQDTCRTLEFVEPTEDNYLENHVRKSILVDNNDQCKVRCYLEDFCLSYNLGIQETGDKFTCELSDSDHYQHPEHLICKKGFSYHPTMKLCGAFFCPPAASCLPNQQGKLRCVCPAHWTRIENCERDTDECSSGSHDCSSDAYCNNTVGSFTCTCKAGFSGDGKTCQNINECVTGSNKCHVDATCKDTRGSYICKCKDNMIGDGVLCLGFPFHWTLNGSDPFVSLHNGASYQNIDGRTVLYLDGKPLSYATTPALPIRTISFSLLCWIKVLSLPRQDVPIHIYSDWSDPVQFRFFIYYKSISANLRRDLQGHNQLKKSLVYFSGGVIIIDQWMYVAFTWSRENREGILYVDGDETGRKTASPGTLNLRKNNHTVFDIGLKGDSPKKRTFHGYLRDLMVIDRAISGDELKRIFTWSKN